MDLLSADERGADGPRRLTVGEMQAALAAAWRGDFTGAAIGGSVTVAPSDVVSTRTAGNTGVVAGAGVVTTGDQLVVVVAAHAGAGASIVAVALADALAAAGERVTLVEAADPRRSGLVEASGVELGEVAGWRRGERVAGAGRVQVERLAEPVSTVGAVLTPRSADGSLLVVDAGWPAWDVLDAPGWIAAALASVLPVVVCRPTVPGLRQAERLLAELPAADRAVVACVGSARWSRLASAECGPRLAAARGAGRLVAVPMHPALAVSGVTCDPLPRPVAVAGRVLAGLVVGDAVSGRPDRATGAAW
jgi:hypothetical protein